MTAITAPVPAQAPRRAASFVDPSSPVFWVMAGLSVVGAVMLVVSDGPGFAEVPAGSLLAIAVWGIYGAIGIGLVIALQRYGRRPALTIVGALAWGGLAATAFAAVGNAALQELLAKLVSTEFVDTYYSSVGTPLVEESLKVAGIVGIALIPGVRLRGPLDGLFYGVMVGAGFQVVEDLFYTISNLQSAADPITGIGGMMLLRGIMLGLFTHATFGGIEGAAIGYFASRRRLSAMRRLLVVAAAIIVVVLIHAFFNGQKELTPMTFVVVASPLVILIALIIWARRDEGRRLAGLAPVAVGRGLMTPEEAEALASDRGSQGDRAARQRRIAQLRYLYRVDAFGPDDARAQALAEKIPAVAPAA